MSLYLCSLSDITGLLKKISVLRWGSPKCYKTLGLPTLSQNSEWCKLLILSGLSQPQQMCMVDSSDGWFCAGGFLMDGSLDIVMNFPSYFKIWKQGSQTFLCLLVFNICLLGASLVAQMVKESGCNAGDPSLIPASGRSPGEPNDNPFWYSRLENLMDRGAWQAAVCGWGCIELDMTERLTHIIDTPLSIAAKQIVIYLVT